VKRRVDFLVFVLVAVACSDSTAPGSPALSVVSGDMQASSQNTELPSPVVVEALDRNGRPMVGARLSVSVSGGSGRVVESDSLTDGSGRFQFRWELGSDYKAAAVVFLASAPEVQTIARATAHYLYRVPEEAGDGWATAALTDVGMAIEPVSILMDSLRVHHYKEVHSVVIVKGGRLVFEEYFSGHDFGYSPPDYLGAPRDFDRHTPHNTHSATKSIVSILVGIAIDEGLIPNEDARVFSYFPDYESLATGGKAEITVQDLLTMRSGLEWHEWDAPVGGGQNDVEGFDNTYDHIRYVLEKPLVQQPGTVFNYNGGTVNILCQIVARAAGVGIDRFAANHLFGPLGISNYAFPRLIDGFIPCHGDIYITPRDMAKLGALYLNGGEWQGHRIVSADWVRRSVAPTVSVSAWHLSWADKYGYLWWLKDYHVAGKTYSSFKALGWGGQEIMVFPEQEMVVVFTGANYVGTPPTDDMLTRFILPALGG
jgi:CubicO group peptidase (beta-lactamase class C family)